MANWGLELNCRNDWIENWRVAEDYADDLLADRAELYAYWDYIEDPYIRGAFGKCANAMFHAYYAFTHLLNYNSEYNPKYNAIYYARHYGGSFGEIELTWKDIIKAFGTAKDPGRMWIVTELDWMRKLVWNENPNIKWQENPFE